MAAALLALAQGCATPPGPRELMQVGPQAAANQELQTRRFSDVGEAELLAAGVSVLQDQGFRIQRSEARLGVIIGVKARPTNDILADLAHQALVAAPTFGFMLPEPERSLGPSNSFSVVLATRAGSRQERDHFVRVMVFRAWGGMGVPSEGGRMRYATVITSPPLYQQFFLMFDAALARSRAGH
jgi:hypothetical protein